MVQVWINEREVSADSAAIVERLEALTAAKARQSFRSFVIFIDDESIKPQLEKMAAEKNLRMCAVTFLGKGKWASKALRKYKIDPEANFKNIVFVNRCSRVVTKIMNLKAEDFEVLEEAVTKLLQERDRRRR